MADNNVEISVRGKWVKVPALEINGKTVVSTGRWFKVAAIHDEDWLDCELEDPEPYIINLAEQRLKEFKVDIFTFTQRLPNTTPKYSYHMEWDNIAAIRPSSFLDWWENKLSHDTRKNIRRSARRGVVTRVTEFSDEFIKGIVEINNESPTRQGRRFPHYGKEFESVKKDYSSFLPRSEFIAAYLGDQLIGFMKIVYIGKVAAIMQLLLKMSHYDKWPANALIAKAVEHCERKGISYLTYCKYRYGNKRESPLTEFKRRNGFEEIPIPRYYVALTVKGRILMALGLHRALVEILPETPIYVLLSLRQMWWERRIRVKPL